MERFTQLTIHLVCMIPAGYMAKRVSIRPESLKAPEVLDVYSVSSCVSEDFTDYIPLWKHNAYWFFDSPQIVKDVARESATSLANTVLFYYEAYELQYDGGNWNPYQPERSFTTNVLVPHRRVEAGFDVVTFHAGSSPECSPLSCNGLAGRVSTNQHCLLGSLDEAIANLSNGVFENSEPGPYRIFSVSLVDWSQFPAP